jgi:Cu/Ag efflux protein CusF
VKSTASWMFGALWAAMVATAGGENAAKPATTPAANAAAPPSMQRETLDEVSATVTSVDAATRMIELRDDSGGTAAFEAGPEVKNFAQIRPGDKVVLSYYRGIAAHVLPPGTATDRKVDQIDLAASAAPGDKPGAGVGSAKHGTVVVQKVDTKANTLTFLHPDGKSRTLPIESEEGRTFIRKLKKGDKIDVVYAEAMAVEVRPQT